MGLSHTINGWALIVYEILNSQKQVTTQLIVDGSSSEICHYLPMGSRYKMGAISKFSKPSSVKNRKI